MYIVQTLHQSEEIPYLIHFLLFKHSHIRIVVTERSGRGHTSCGCVSTSYCQPPPTTDGSGVIDIRIVTTVRKLKLFFLNQNSPLYKCVWFKSEATSFGSGHTIKVPCRGVYCSHLGNIPYIRNQ